MHWQDGLYLLQGFPLPHGDPEDHNHYDHHARARRGVGWDMAATYATLAQPVLSHVGSQQPICSGTAESAEKSRPLSLQVKTMRVRGCLVNASMY